MDVRIRPVEPPEFADYARMVESAFSAIAREEDLENERKLFEPGRYLVALDGSQMVGGAGACSCRMAVPGGAVDAAGITSVGVIPTHRRRGINSALMRRQLDDIHERGEPVSILYASEGGIYGRFGYGLGSFRAEIDVESGHTAFVRGYERSGRVRLLDREGAGPFIRAVYDAILPVPPGTIAMDDRWFDWYRGELEWGKKDEAFFYAVHESETGGADAYAVYQVTQRWRAGVFRSELTVRALGATTSQAYADTWRFLFDIDLIHRVRSWNQPPDDPLLHLLADPRRLRFTVGDGLWVRLVDVRAALAARRYATEGRVVFQVSDRFCPWNEGCYELVAAPSAVECRRTEAPAQIVCTVNDLGAAYLGGTSFRQLARANRVHAPDPTALTEADAMFAWDPAPWCAFHF